MDEDNVTKTIAETLQWAAKRADLPAITDIELAEGETNVILFNTLDGQPFSITIEAI